MLEGRLESDPRPGVGYIEAVGGRIFELSPLAAGAAASSTPGVGGAAATLPAANPGPGGEIDRPSVGEGGSALERFKSTAPLAAAAVVASAFGFGLGMAMAPEPAPPPPTRIFIAPSSTAPPTSSALKPAQLTIGEQRARQENRLARDRAKRELLDSRVAQDEELLRELGRQERERGADSPAVKLGATAGVFPPDTGPGVSKGLK